MHLEADHGQLPDPNDKLNILIAEDNHINQLVLIRMVEKLGFRPDAVSNGSEVLEAIQKKKYDILFMDIQMPVMNGLEATKHLRQMLRSDELPHIVAVTANALVGDRERFISAGMHEYISKPLHNAAVSSVIQRFIDSKAFQTKTLK
nr:response regulator [Paenibacillus lupini]